jgi:hypothetical protein
MPDTPTPPSSDSALELRGSTAVTSTSAPTPPAESTSTEADQELADARAKLRETAALLPTAKNRDIPKLLGRIQKLRVLVMVLQETQAGSKPDKDTYREMSLLNRMAPALAGQDDSDDDDAASEALDASRSSLEAFGIDAQSAARLTTTLEAMVNRVPIAAGSAAPAAVEADDEKDADEEEESFGPAEPRPVG